jgi:glycosyltransferase involved in cell wall biosynthesis
MGVGADFSLSDTFPADVHARIEINAFVMDREALRAAYRRCAIVIAPSQYESFGLAAAEAMACGCALVASRTGFAAGLRDGIEACLLPTPSSPHLYACVKSLMENTRTRIAVAAGGYQRVQQLRWGVAADTLASHYSGWLAELRGSRQVQ